MKKIVDNTLFQKVLVLILILFFAGIFLISTVGDNTITYLPEDFTGSNSGEVLDDDGILRIENNDKISVAYGYSPVMNLSKGNYTLHFDYTTDAEQSFVLIHNQKVIYSDTFKKDSLGSDFTFTLDQDADDIQIILNYSGNGSLQFQGVELEKEGLFYTDGVFLALIVVILGAGYLFLARKKEEKNLLVKEEERWIYVALTATVLFVSLPLFSNYIIGGHDINFHLMRIEGIKDGLLSGQFPVNLYTQNNRGYGYLGSLYPSLFLYIPAALRCFGVSMVLSYKIMLFIIHGGTAFVAYYSVKVITKGSNKRAAALAAILYTLAPYRLVNSYYRAAIGELIAMIFIPLVIAGLYQIFVGNKREWYLLVIGFTGILESHILMVLFMVGLSGVIFCFYFKKIFQEKRILELILAGIATIFINLGFLVPFLYYVKGNLNSDAFTVDFAEHSVFLQQILQTMVSVGDSLSIKEGILGEMPLTIGIVGGLCFFLSGVFLFQKKREKEEDLLTKEELIFARILFFLGAGFLLISTTLFPWKELEQLKVIEKVVSMFQFPWRFLGVATGLIIVVVGIVFTGKATTPSLKYKRQAAVVLTLFGVIAAAVLMDTYEKQDVSYGKISGGYTVGEVRDYLPQGTDTSIFQTSDYQLENVEDEKSIVSYEKKGLTIQFQYKTQGEKQGSILLPLLYYKGYAAVTESGEQLAVTKSDRNTVRVLLPQEKEGTLVKITVSYQGNKNIWLEGSFIFSILSSILLILYFRKRSLFEHQKSIAG